MLGQVLLEAGRSPGWQSKATQRLGHVLWLIQQSGSYVSVTVQPQPCPAR